jgi:phage-related holin
MKLLLNSLQTFFQNVGNFFKTVGEEIADTFGFTGVEDFFSSLVHTKLLLFTLPSALILFGFIEKWLGITSAIFIAFGVMAALELITGLWGSRAIGKKFSSKKFSRFGLKALVWMSLIMVANSFKTSYENLKGIQNVIIFQMFYWIHGTLVVYVAMEYMISILENFSKITGQKENKLLKFLKKKLDQWFETADNATDPNKVTGNNETKIDVDLPVIEDKPQEESQPMEG